MQDDNDAIAGDEFQLGQGQQKHGELNSGFTKRTVSFLMTDDLVWHSLRNSFGLRNYFYLLIAYVFISAVIMIIVALTEKLFDFGSLATSAAAITLVTIAILYSGYYWWFFSIALVLVRLRLRSFQAEKYITPSLRKNFPPLAQQVRAITHGRFLRELRSSRKFGTWYSFLQYILFLPK